MSSHATFSSISTHASSRSKIDEKILRGQFFTVANPFKHKLFRKWLSLTPAEGRLLEPFAGSNNLVRLLREIGEARTFESYDIAPADPGVIKKDTLKSFPRGYDVVVTNPPYIAKNSATRRGYHIDFKGYDDLYKTAIAECLKHSGWVAAIIPESFITSGLFRNRLYGVISLTCQMFDDTECPVCLALWTPKQTDDFSVYSGDKYLGMFKSLESSRPTPKAILSVKFNNPTGAIGLIAIDNQQGPSISFCLGEAIPDHKIKSTGRSVTRISIPFNITNKQKKALIDCANKLLAEYREQTHDVMLTSFKGLRRDGRYRRRLDFETARQLISLAAEEVLA